MTNYKRTDRENLKCTIKCAVPGCVSKFNVNLDVGFHCFPKQNQRVVYIENLFGTVEKVDQFKLWQRRTKIPEVTKHTRICSLHFKKDDYLLPDVPAKKRYLKKTANPSLLLPNVDAEKEKKKTEINEQRLKRRKNRETRQILAAEEPAAEDQAFPQHEDDINSDVDIAEHHCFNESPAWEPEPPIKHVETQVKSGDLGTKFLDFIKNDENLSTATGITSFALLDTILRIIVISGLRKDDNVIKMNLKDRVVLTFVKLKQNLSYAFLAVLFDISAKHCQRVFEDTVSLLSVCLKPFVCWPSKNEILKNMPLCFTGFEDVRVVVDCTEIFIESPKNLCCQILTYSHYKSAQTCKIMTGVTPAGNISFISKVYGGRSSDKAIFEQSGMINCMEPGDAIMVDRGFLIDESCSLHNIKCVRPPFLKGKKQFCYSDAMDTDKIAKARVHVERSNQRIKVFKIVGDTLPVNLIPLLQDIFNVICAVVNLSAPILKDDKFVDV